MTTTEKLGTYIAEAVAVAAARKLQRDGVDVRALLRDGKRYLRFHALVKEEARAAVGPALEDAREALDAGMDPVAETTFNASLVLAGARAAERFQAGETV